MAYTVKNLNFLPSIAEESQRKFRDRDRKRNKSKNRGAHKSLKIFLETVICG